MANRINPNSAIVYLSIFLIIVLSSVAYAVLSDSLLVSGTASAKGTFDLEFQNATVVSEETDGVDENNTTAVISEKGNVLTVNVADISFPGAGATFSVDIANVGSIPAKVKSVIQTNIKDSGLAKITGLEQIGIDRPSIEAKDKYNLKFRVEWDPEITDEEYVNNLLATEGDTVSFKLEIEYEQNTGDVFDGKASHDDVEQERPPVSLGKPNPTYDVPTNLTAILGQKLSDVTLPKGFSWSDSASTALTNLGMNTFKATYTPDDTENYATVNNIDLLVMVYEKQGTLASIIDPNDYGKTVNYNVTVNGVLLNNWRVFYNDGKNVQIIYGDYLPNVLVPEETGLTPASDRTYGVGSGMEAIEANYAAAREQLIKGLTTTDYWSEFAAITGSTAVGAPSYETFVASWNQNPAVNSKKISVTEQYNNADIQIFDSTKLYIPHDTEYDNNKCFGYWFTTSHSNDRSVWSESFRGSAWILATNKSRAARPVVTLPATATGKVGNTVVIDTEKAMPQYAVPKGLKATAGQTLADVKLPEGFSWNSPTTSVGSLGSKNSFKATYTPSNTSIYQIVENIDIQVEVVKSGKLTQIVTGEDYGKTINYSTTVKGQQVNTWKIFHNDGNNIYIILSDYLPQTLVPQAALSAGLTLPAGRTYSVTGTSRDNLVKAIATSSYWTEFAQGMSGATANGSPTYKQLVASWNANPKVNSRILVEGTEYNTTGDLPDDTTGLYHPHRDQIDNGGCYGYWLATPWSGSTTHIWRTSYSGRIYINTNTKDVYCTRPIVCLPATATGTVGENVEIQK